MEGVNKVILVGRLGRDPEGAQTGRGTEVCRFSVATTANWTDKDQQRQQRTEWHRVVAWGKLADLCTQYLRKGRLVYVEGKNVTRTYDDRNGVSRQVTEVVASAVQFLGPKHESNASDVGDAGGGGGQYGRGVAFGGRQPGEDREPDDGPAFDEIPF